MNSRSYEISRGVRVDKNPDDMSRDELINAIDDLGEYASSVLIQMRALRSVLQAALRRDNT